MEVLISVCWFPVYCDVDGVVWSSCDPGVQQMEGSHQYLVVPAYPPIPVIPYPLPLTYTAPSLVSTHIYLISLTFSLEPE